MIDRAETSEMGADVNSQTASRVPATIEHAATARSADRRFWVGLACAAVLHAAFIFGFLRSPSRVVGEREGRPDGISVVLVDAADLQSRNTVPSPTDPSPPGADNAAQPSKPSPASPPTPAPAPASAPQEAAALPERETPHPLPGSSDSQRAPPADRKNAARPPAKPKLPPRLSLPEAAFTPGGLDASVVRPPGVTRTGENDEFARGVIRALRKTMPAASGTFGRVTVRLLLNEMGNLSDLNLVRGAEDAILNQTVVFAARQTSFPIPPAGATLADRTFLVTYVYR